MIQPKCSFMFWKNSLFKGCSHVTTSVKLTQVLGTVWVVIGLAIIIVVGGVMLGCIKWYQPLMELIGS